MLYRTRVLPERVSLTSMRLRRDLGDGAGSCTATSRATGKSAFNEWTHLFKIQGGNIIYFQNSELLPAASSCMSPSP